MKGLMKAAKNDPETGDPHLSNPMANFEKQEESLEVTEDQIEDAMKPAISQPEGGGDDGGNPNTHNSSQCESKFRTFTSKQTEMGEIG